MLILHIEHVDMAGPDGQTMDDSIAKFQKEEDAEHAYKYLLTQFPSKNFYVTDEEDLPINPTDKELRRIVVQNYGEQKQRINNIVYTYNHKDEEVKLTTVSLGKVERDEEFYQIFGRDNEPNTNDGDNQECS